jgi:D-alanyl-D-alanine carboxypeptidase/D-alanyl-D-alanine-endopeptidase (penicillin-binding protein 4)
VDTATGAVALRGTVPPDRIDTVNVVFPRQEEAYLAALAAALRARGITVDSATRTSPGAPLPHVSSATTQALFTYWSPPLRDVLRALEKPSQNQIAEILLRTLGLGRGGAGTPDSGRAIVERQLLAWGAERDGFVIRDGSGLSRYDYVSPETLVHVLTAIRKDTAFAAFYDALPVAGVDGTIAKRMRGTPAAGNMHAKTGSIANARSLSGYVTTADGRVLVFSMLANNWTVPASHVLRVQDAIGARLAALTLKGSR